VAREIRKSQTKAAADRITLPSNYKSHECTVKVHSCHKWAGLHQRNRMLFSKRSGAREWYTCM